MLEVRNLSKSFGESTILRDVSFTVNDGDSVVIIGGSGCGKSTLLRCLNHLIVPEKGEILFNGKNILDKHVDIDEYRRHIGMVYQHFNLFEHLNIMENMILAPMKVLRMDKDEAISKAESLLDRVGMINSRYKMPTALSGGQKQRVAIARTLMMKPDMILFDEPTSALDPTMVDEVESVIKDLISGGMTSVIVTHEMRFAEKISNRTIFLAEKGIYETGPSSQIFQNPQRDITRQFIYRSRLFSRKVADGSEDFRSLLSDLRRHAVSYGLTARQSNAIESLFDEILIPVVKAGNRAVVQFVCNESGSGHKLMLKFPTLSSDPLALPAIDELGLKIVSSTTTGLCSHENNEGAWEVTAEI